MKYIFNFDGVNFYIYLIGLYILLRTKTNDLFLYVYHLFKRGIVVFFILTLYFLISFLLGKGFDVSGAKTVILQYDVLTWVGIFQITCLTLYLIRRKRKYLMLSIYFLLVVVLSLSRSVIWLSIISSFAVIMFDLFYRKSFINALVTFILSLVLLISSLVILEKAKIIDIDIITDRSVSAFSYFNKSFSTSEYNDRGHIEQSLLTTAYMMDNISDQFWGIGMQKSLIDTKFVPGSSTGGVHNSFVLAWAKHGLFMTIYIVVIGLFMLYKLFKFIVIDRTKSKNHNGNILIFSILFVNSYLLLASWSSGTVQYILSDSIAISQFLFLFVLIRIKRFDYNNIPI